MTTPPDNRYGEVYIASYPDTELRLAVWSHNGQHIADLEAPESDAITWARKRASEIWLWAPEDNQYRRLD